MVCCMYEVKNKNYVAQGRAVDDEGKEARLMPRTQVLPIYTLEEFNYKVCARCGHGRCSSTIYVTSFPVMSHCKPCWIIFFESVGGGGEGSNGQTHFSTKLLGRGVNASARRKRVSLLLHGFSVIYICPSTT